jgi:hypothetical protein
VTFYCFIAKRREKTRKLANYYGYFNCDILGKSSVFCKNPISHRRNTTWVRPLKNPQNFEQKQNGGSQTPNQPKKASAKRNEIKIKMIKSLALGTVISLISQIQWNKKRVESIN